MRLEEEERQRQEEEGICVSVLGYIRIAEMSFQSGGVERRRRSDGGRQRRSASGKRKRNGSVKQQRKVWFIKLNPEFMYFQRSGNGKQTRSASARKRKVQ